MRSPLQVTEANLRDGEARTTTGNTREAAAFNVAAYYVVQRLLVPGWRPERLSIEEDDRELEEPGRPPSCGWDFAHQLDPNLHDIEVVAVTIYAGTTAQLWRVQAVDLCTAARFEWADEMLMVRTPNDAERAHLRASLLTRAAALVREHWDVIETLASLLYERGLVPCEDADRITGEVSFE